MLILLSLVQHSSNSRRRTFLVDDGDSSIDTEGPRKRARARDPGATSKQWYPWSDKIVSQSYAFLVRFPTVTVTRIIDLHPRHINALAKISFLASPA